MPAAVSVAYRKRSWTQSELGAGLILTVVGLGLLLVPMGFYWREQDFLAHAVETKGSVVRVIVSPTYRRGRVNHVPEIRFADRDGKIWTVVSRAPAPSSCAAGQSLGVLYDARDPGRAQPNGSASTAANWTPSLNLAIVGIVLLPVGLYKIGSRVRELSCQRRRRRPIPGCP